MSTLPSVFCRKTYNKFCNSISYATLVLRKLPGLALPCIIGRRHGCPPQVGSQGSCYR
jgi:hypothetical protein